MKRLNKLKLFPKTFLFLISIFSIVIATIYISIYIFLPKIYIYNVDTDFTQNLDHLVSTIENTNYQDCAILLDEYAKRNGQNITMISEGKETNFVGSNLLITITDNQDQHIEIDQIAGFNSILFKNREVNTKDQKHLILKVSLSLEPIREPLQLIFILLPITAIFAVFLAILFSYLYSHKLTASITNMVDVTRRMQQLESNAFFEIQSYDEIGMLAEQINIVYEKLRETIGSLEKEKAYISMMEQSKVDFLRSASHELKTPLAGLRISLENMQYNIGKYKDHETYLAQGINTIDKMTKMIQEIMETSNNQWTIDQLEKEHIFPSQIITDLYKEYDILAKNKSISVSITITSELSITMNKKHFTSVWSNLISNAVRYTPLNGNICIIGDNEKLVIKNSCTPLNEEQLSQIFDAFYRPDFARDAYSGGSGFGLYVVKTLLEANELHYSFKPYEEGMCFTIYIHSNYD